MKRPKWQTDTVWALRRARKKGRLPDEVEQLFFGDVDYCLQYARAVRDNTKVGHFRLSEMLEKSITDVFDNPECPLHHDRKVVDWITSYKQCAIEIDPKFEEIFIKRIKDACQTRYDWGSERLLKYAALCGTVSEKLEEVLWGNEYTAFKYSTSSGKRIPKSFELDFLSKFDEDEIVSYSKKIFKGRLPPELESVLTNTPDAALQYAKEIIHGQLPDSIHTAMVMKTFEKNKQVDYAVSQYLDFVKEAQRHTMSILANFDKNATVDDVLKAIGEKNEQ